MDSKISKQQEILRLCREDGERRERLAAMQKVTALIVEPGKLPYIKEIATDHKTLASIVEGHLERINPYRDEVQIICNEYGKVMGLPSNRAILSPKGVVVDVIAGTFIVIGDKEYEELYSSLTDADIEKYYEMFKDPVCQWRYVL